MGVTGEDEETPQPRFIVVPIETNPAMPVTVFCIKRTDRSNHWVMGGSGLPVEFTIEANAQEYADRLNNVQRHTDPEPYWESL